MTNRTFLRNILLFSELPDPDMDELLEIIVEKQYRKDEVIFHVDDPGSAIFILKSGLVKISICDGNGREDILKIIYPPDCFGEMSILDGQHRSATVTAMEKSHALLIKRDKFINLIRKQPQIALNMLAIMSRRVRKTDEKIASLRFADAYGKVAKVILDLAEENGVRENGVIVINLKFGRQELADLAGVTRETVTRILNEFHGSGRLIVDGKQIVINNEAALRRELY